MGEDTVVMTGAWLRDKLPGAPAFFFYSTSLVGFNEEMWLHFTVDLSNGLAVNISSTFEDGYQLKGASCCLVLLENRLVIDVT